MGHFIPLWHITCNSHTGNVLAKGMVDVTKKSTISISKEFENVDLLALLRKEGVNVVLRTDTRWCSYLNSYAVIS